MQVKAAHKHVDEIDPSPTSRPALLLPQGQLHAVWGLPQASSGPSGSWHLPGGPFPDRAEHDEGLWQALQKMLSVRDSSSGEFFFPATVQKSC